MPYRWIVTPKLSQGLRQLGVEMESMEDVWRRTGPLVAGAVFGVAWWIWFDGVLCSHDKVNVLHYLPG